MCVCVCVCVCVCCNIINKECMLFHLCVADAWRFSIYKNHTQRSSFPSPVLIIKQIKEIEHTDVGIIKVNHLQFFKRGWVPQSVEASRPKWI